MKEGIYHDMPFDEYRAIDAVNASLLCDAGKSMLHAKWSLDNPMKDTPSLSWGRTVHTALLEPEKANLVECGLDKRTKAYKEFRAEHEGMDIVTPDQALALRLMADSLMANPEARDLLKESEFEVTLVWNEKGVGPCKARIDILQAGSAVADLKTTANLFKFPYTATDLEYIGKMSWYSLAVERLTGFTLPIYFIAIESAGPFAVQVYEAGSCDVVMYQEEMKRRAKEWARCKAAGVYPGPSEGIKPLNIPEWRMAQLSRTVQPLELEEMEASQL